MAQHSCMDDPDSCEACHPSEDRLNDKCERDDMAWAKSGTPIYSDNTNDRLTNIEIRITRIEDLLRKCGIFSR